MTLTFIDDDILSRENYEKYLLRLLRLSFLWRENSNCLNLPKSKMYPLRTKDQIKVAAQYCSTCPNSAQCLELALVGKEEFGVWGGTTQKERQLLQDTISSFCQNEFTENWTDNIAQFIQQLSIKISQEKKKVVEKDIVFQEKTLQTQT